MGLLGNLFKKKTLTFLGRGGIAVRYQGEEYSLDSEMLVGAEWNMVIYVESLQIKKKDGHYWVDEPLKSSVLDFVKNELPKYSVTADFSTVPYTRD
ncbi:MAG: hypothetical protein EOP04_10390 [Proteobacteria bacterium]|nr:MAG: hypothetical protein EOP04_10390 [Pseudomonadota bacterium]